MKTPRELLLNRHREAEPALDERRRDVLRTLRRRDAAAASQTGGTDAGFFGTLWLELFVACRRYWMGLGAAWFVIVAGLVLTRDGESGRALASTTPTAPVIQAMREQRRLREELLGMTVVEEARAAQHEPTLGPRSEVTAESANV